MMFDQLVHDGAQIQLNCSRKPKQLPKDKGRHANNKQWPMPANIQKEGSSLKYCFFQGYKHNLSLDSSSATPLWES